MALQLKRAFSLLILPLGGLRFDCVIHMEMCVDHAPLIVPYAAVLSLQVILDLKGSDYSWSYQTPPSSPSTTMSRKSSVYR